MLVLVLVYIIPYALELVCVTPQVLVVVWDVLVSHFVVMVELRYLEALNGSVQSYGEWSNLRLLCFGEAITTPKKHTPHRSMSVNLAIINSCAS